MPEHPIDVQLNDGEMKRIEVEGKAIVLAKVEEQVYAFGGKCTHYGAPLDEGVLRGHTVICPWHHACFDIRNGERLEPPALNDLPRYPVTVRDGTILVTLPNDNVTAPQGKADPANPATFVIAGGGAAAGAAAEELRRAGFGGRIVIVTAVPDMPIDRPNLSKDYLDGHARPEWIPLRSHEWYAQRDIEFILETEVDRVQPEAHTVSLSNGQTIGYDRLLLATGAIPRQLKNIPGVDLDGIYTLRSLADADRIIQAVEHGKNVAIVGASFIGMEVAAELADGRGASVTVIGLEALPFAPILGDQIGQMFQKLHEDNGIRFCLEDTVTRFVEGQGVVRQVELKSGRVIDAEVVIVGIGVIPATEFLNNSGIALDEKDRSVRVNDRLQTSHPDIYAAGDIARWSSDGQSSTRIEHWRVAQQHGLVAARNMLGGQESVLDHVPFFWTTQWGLTLNYVGHAAQWDNIIYRGSPAQKKFIAFYFHQGELKAAAGCGYDTELAALEMILRHQLPFSIAQAQNEAFDLVAYARSAR